MSRPSFSASKSVVPSVGKKYFTVAHANATLPLVKRVVADVVRTHDRALSLQELIENPKDPKATPTVQVELELSLDKLRAQVVELAEIGCELKDYRTGLIDFLGTHRGRDVYLCWRPGEERIHFWHELTAGVAGRRPIATLVESA